jgi:uridine phosphorylase
MRRRSYPILEFDAAQRAVIEPRDVVEPADVPEACVVCFFGEVIAKVCVEGKARVAAVMQWEVGDRPVYVLEHAGQSVGVFHPGVGAPLTTGLLEEAIALGFRKFIACGGAGVLNRDIAVGRIIVPSSAVRDEGTSYHYLPPGRETQASPEGIAAIEAVLKRHNVPYTVGKTWTTDAPYRETPEKVQLRKREGCLTVEMEAAAFFALAEFRGVTFAQMLYGGDDVSGTKWDSRQWTKRTSIREQVFWLAVEACLEL